MKTIKAFAVSLLLCALTIVGLHLYSGRGFSAEGKAGTWVSDAKSQSGSTLKKMAADENAVLIFGSSELRHGQGSGFHGDTIFDGADMDPIYVGKAGYQSLTHAITLGAVGSQAANKKAVLIVSPQWYMQCIFCMVGAVWLLDRRQPWKTQWILLLMRYSGMG